MTLDPDCCLPVFVWKDSNPVYFPMMEPNPEYFSNDGSESWIFFNDGSESWIFSKGRIQLLNTIHSFQRTDLNPEYFPKDVSEFKIFSKRRIRIQNIFQKTDPILWFPKGRIRVLNIFKSRIQIKTDWIRALTFPLPISFSSHSVNSFSSMTMMMKSVQRELKI